MEGGRVSGRVAEAVHQGSDEAPRAVPVLDRSGTHAAPDRREGVPSEREDDPVMTEPQMFWSLFTVVSLGLVYKAGILRRLAGLFVDFIVWCGLEQETLEWIRTASTGEPASSPKGLPLTRGPHGGLQIVEPSNVVKLFK